MQAGVAVDRYLQYGRGIAEIHGGVLSVALPAPPGFYGRHVTRMKKLNINEL